MLEIEPSAVAALAEIKPTDPLPDLTEIEATLSACAVNANGWVQSICAPKKNYAKSRPSTPR